MVLIVWFGACSPDPGTAPKESSEADSTDSTADDSSTPTDSIPSETGESGGDSTATTEPHPWLVGRGVYHRSSRSWQNVEDFGGIATDVPVLGRDALILWDGEQTSIEAPDLYGHDDQRWVVTDVEWSHDGQGLGNSQYIVGEVGDDLAVFTGAPASPETSALTADTFLAEAAYYYEAIDDVTGDGVTDILVADTDWSYILPGPLPPGVTGFGDALTVIDGTGRANATVADMDGDGSPDLVVGAYNTAYFVVVYGPLPAGRYYLDEIAGARIEPALPYHNQSGVFAAGDPDGDGRQAVGWDFSGGIAIFDGVDRGETRTTPDWAFDVEDQRAIGGRVVSIDPDRDGDVGLAFSTYDGGVDNAIHHVFPDFPSFGIEGAQADLIVTEEGTEGDVARPARLGGPSADLVSWDYQADAVYAWALLDREDTPTDVDRDGFDAPDDCDDGDPTVHPGRAEVADGVDQDCDGTTDEVGPTVTALAEAPLVPGHAGSRIGTSLGTWDPDWSGVDQLVILADTDYGGSARVVPAPGEFDSPTLLLTGSHSSFATGGSDTDGDGAAELLLSASDVWVISGPLTGTVAYASSAQAWSIDTGSADAGGIVSDAGDLDGDGLSEVLCSGTYPYWGYYTPSEMLLVRGRADPANVAYADVDVVFRSNDTKFPGAKRPTGADLDGDGYGDILLATTEGAYGFLGPTGESLVSWEDADLQIDIVVDRVVVGDPDADGAIDAIFSYSEGGAYAFRGPMGTLTAADADWSIARGDPDDLLGADMLLIGDRLYLGAPDSDAGGWAAGAVYVYAAPFTGGAASRDDATEVLVGTHTFDRVGTSLTSYVATDGSTRVATGSPGYDVALDQEGAILDFATE